MQGYNLISANLSLFDGEAEASGDAGASGGTADIPAGRESDEQQTDSQQTVESPSPDEKRRAWRKLVEGEYKDQLAAELHKGEQETRELREQLERERPVLELLRQRYRVDTPDQLAQAIEQDDLYWQHAADEAGMEVEQYKRVQRLERENAELLRREQEQLGRRRAQEQMLKWDGEAEQLKAEYPSFDLNAEARDPQFVALLRSGVPMRHAYEVLHMDEIKAAVGQEAEKRITDGIRARGARPAENGVSAQSAFTMQKDVSRLTKKERAELARRAAKGETIAF